MKEEIAIKQWAHLDSFVYQLNQVFLKQERKCIIVLVLDDVLDHLIQSKHLVVFKGDLNWCSDVLLALTDLDHLVEQGLLFQFWIIVTKKFVK